MTTTPRPTRLRYIAVAATVLASVVAGLVVMYVRTRTTARVVATFTELLDAANRGDLEKARRLCSTRYLRTHQLVPAAEGGLVGLPRQIHKNFQVWRRGPNIWICPTDRVGPVYQFVPEAGGWRFDGPVGLLRAGGVIVPLPESLEHPADAGPR